MAVGKTQFASSAAYALLASCGLLILWIGTVNARPNSALQDGDILFQTSHSSQSEAIELATHSRFSHVGILFYRKGKPFVYEAIGHVSWTPLSEWIRQGDHGHYVVKRLKGLKADGAQKLREAAAHYTGLPYDPYFEWGDDRMYCSELVWKVYKRALNQDVGARRRFGEFDLTDPRVIAKMRERFGATLPLQEPVISPGDIFKSDALEDVESK